MMSGVIKKLYIQLGCGRLLSSCPHNKKAKIAMRVLSGLLLTLFVLLAVPSMAAQNNRKNYIQRTSVKMALVSEGPARGSLVVGKKNQIIVKLTARKDGRPITFADLREVHTKKLHLLVVDPTLTDYQHIHPTAGKKPGEFVFDFVPEKRGPYRVWADITPFTSGKQEYVRADIGGGKQNLNPNPPISMEVKQDGYKFVLSFDEPPQARQATMGHIKVTKDDKPFMGLQPVMGAFAHIVGFSADYQSVTHVHPMGAEPTRDSDRGGPQLDFHIEPQKTGAIKLFAQMRIEGKEVFVPFSIRVK